MVCLIYACENFTVTVLEYCNSPPSFVIFFLICSFYSGDTNGIVYANVLMNVYEDIARKHEEHLRIIESNYGMV